jgi:hypothetical protein
LIPGGKGAFALDAVAFLLVADLLAKLFFEREKQVEGDVGWLEFFGIRVGDVMRQRAVGRDAWGGEWLKVAGYRSGIATS